jgi:hypothetical protein
MHPLPLQTQTVFAELSERALAREAARSVHQLAGSFAKKRVAGHEYWYFKASSPGAGQREYYLGSETPALRRVIDAHREGRATDANEEDELARLCAMLRAGGANRVDATAARVLKALGDGGLFRLGGVLVGTYAFVVLGNVLGVRWLRAAMTQDIDIAAHSALSIAVPTLAADAPSLLGGLQMGFLPVPGLDPRSASTSFKVRGRELRVDFLTPARGSRRTRTISIPRLNVSATPLEMLDFLIDDAIHTVAVNGGAVAVTVPDAARYALHKLAVADRRPLASQAKATKDRQQAQDLLEWLERERPGDIARALRAARSKYPATLARIRKAAQRLPDTPSRKQILEAR